MRKTLILVLAILLTTATVALASWGIADWIRGEPEEQVGAEAAAAPAVTEGPAPPEAESDEGGDAAEEEVSASGVPMTGEALQYTSPDYRYVTETQRHQNFFKALAEGQVKRLDVTATDFQPVGDPNSSYVYFTLTCTDGSRSDGMMVMKYEDGLWRIGAVRQLAGDLGGGTNYMVPASFEDDLARELRELQEFLTKVAEGRLGYLTVDSVNQTGACEVIINGTVVSKGGKVFPAEMCLRKDYNLWHITYILCL
ncbi:MAG: hypothetical protein SWK76_06510 [Actinomycetota bacterium]|nr:hypothetical protein [Actinomycetota bacterium]